MSQRHDADAMLPKLIASYGRAAEYEADQTAALMGALLRVIRKLAARDARHALSMLHQFAVQLWAVERRLDGEEAGLCKEREPG